MDRVPMDAQERERFLLEAGDLLFARQSLKLEGAGQCSLVLQAKEPRTFESHLIRCRLDTQKAAPGFYFYFFWSPQGRALMGSIVEQVAAAGIRGSDLRRLPVPLPPIDEQRRIAAVLGALDDKIELNRKMNRTLEEMAQAIFKSWFIDFDGVDASEIVDSELGPIPKGWKVSTLGNVALQHRENVDPTEEAADTPYVGLADIPQRSIALDNWGVAADATSAKTSFNAGDILFGKLRPYFKKIVVAPVNGICSSDIVVVRAKKPEDYGYVLGLLTLDAFVDFTTAVSTGTRMPRVSWKAMAGYKIAEPPPELRRRFTEFVRAISERIQLNVMSSRTLADLGDTLLPKLISGEIRIPAAEKTLEAHL
jgi:type I restriction enzyme S subunit